MGTKLTVAQVYALAREAGLDAGPAVIAVAVAIGESGLDPNIEGDKGIQTSTWGPSIGLWQIRSLKAESGTGKSRDATRLKDPRFNARSMASISGTGKNWQPWSVYTSGNWKKHVEKVVPVAQDIDLRSGGLGDVLGSVGGAVSDVAGSVGGAVADAAAAANPFGGWQNDVQGIAVKLAVSGAALALVVMGVRATVQS